jgi:endonuclease/exonuclease/phosphatase family metal-dependent hydrolase
MMDSPVPPGSSNKGTKIERLEAVLAVVSEWSAAPCLLCGDFNVPQAEAPQGGS